MSILSIAYTGLNAFQRALDVTSNNIANATTRGYTRQTIQFTPGISQRYAGSFIGTGVAVNNINRNADMFAATQVRGTLSVKSQYDAFYQQAVQIDKLLSQDGTSISTSLQSFFTALGQVNSSPDGMPARGVALNTSKLMVQQFNSMQLRLDEFQRGSNMQISTSVSKINQLTRGIADVNEKLMSSPGSPELLDQKDLLLEQLSEFGELIVSNELNGTVSVGIANGGMLVTGTDQHDLSVATSDSNANITAFGTRIFINNGAGQIDITDKLLSGSLKGLLDYEQNVLAKASQMIGQMAIGLAQTFNSQHKLGMDLNNQIGKDLFTDYNTATKQLNRSIPMGGNTGTGVLSVAISDIAQTKLTDYELVVTDAASNEVRLIRKSDGSAMTMNWSSSPPAPPAGQLVVDGMTITVNDIGNLADDDKFTLIPTRGAARDLAMQITDPRELALAAPVMTIAPLSNQGNGKIQLGKVFNTTEVQKEYRVEFTSDSQYNLVNVTDGVTTGPFAFTPNTDNTVSIPDSSSPSYTVVISGIPKQGDQFSTQYNAGGFGDNRNGLALSGIQDSKIFSGGTETLVGRYAMLLSDVGGQTNDAKTQGLTADVLYKQAVNERDSNSGVNLDEEANNLLKYKQAYEAAGKLMQISSQIMNILMDMMR